MLPPCACESLPALLTFEPLLDEAEDELLLDEVDGAVVVVVVDVDGVVLCVVAEEEFDVDVAVEVVLLFELDADAASEAEWVMPTIKPTVAREAPATVAHTAAREGRRG